MTPTRVLIAGAGLAGARTAERLRELGCTGTITLVGAEPHPPYDRPPLSKGVLRGSEDPALDIDFAALDVELLLGRTATGLRPAERLLDTDAGPLPYDHLVLATGAEPVTLPGTGARPGVHVLRTLDDARRLKPVLDAGGSVVAVGAGWIGAEVTSAARAAGCRVTVVEAAAQPLAGALPPEVAAHLGAWYAEAGAELRTGVAVDAVREREVELTDGTVLGADAALIGIGSRPATGWLAGSGVPLGADGSVLADERLRTGLPGIWAAGDCASYPSARYGRRLLVHHWDNALAAPATVAAGILAETEGPAEGGGAGRNVPAHDPVPYFWSEQFGRYVQYAGHHASEDTLLWRGDPAADAAWSVCWLREGVLRAVLAVDRPRDLTQGRRLIERATPLRADLATDPAVPLKAAAR